MFPRCFSIENRDYDFSDILDVFVEMSEVGEADLTKWTTIRFSFVLRDDMLETNNYDKLTEAQIS